MLRVKYLGPVNDYSGYGEASRHHIAALQTAGVETMLDRVNYTTESVDFGTMNPYIAAAEKARGDYKIKLLHTTPNVFRQYIEPDKYNIGFMYWETSRLPDAFAEGLQLCDEIWTGSLANKDAILSTGVDKPVEIFPQAAEANTARAKKFQIPDFSGYLFYSIFEWTDRKNPTALIHAFLQEFKGRQDVGLLLKTYVKDFSSTNRRLVRQYVNQAREASGIEGAPPIFLYLDLLDRDQVRRLHATGDCFVSANRGEGWGVPQVEAALAGNSVITTAYGGCAEYFTNEKDMFLLPYSLIPLKGMYHSEWYDKTQLWADPDASMLRQYLVYCYSQQEAAKAVGRAGQKTAQKLFNFDRVGRMMADRLEKIEATL